MSRLTSVHELLRHNEWAREKLIDLTKDAADTALDRPFEMGLGTLRSTLHHMWAAERIWLDRWTGVAQPKFVQPEAGLPIDALVDRFRTTAAERTAWLNGKTEPDLDRPITFTNIKGETFALPLGPMLVHVCNHGIHHRAQAVNMLRHVGIKPPRLDYIFMKIESSPATPLDHSLKMICDYYGYGDWGNDRVLEAASELDDATLNQPFEMGLGTLRKTLVHICDAERWWYGNWVHGPQHLFPAADETISLADLRARFRETVETRQAYLARMTDDDLKKPVSGQPVKDVFRNFPIGETMLQLCGHGTHHRAQAINMLRRVGRSAPAMDYIVWVRDTQKA